MASLKFIIDMDVDDEQPSSRPNKDILAPASSSAPTFPGQLSNSSTTAQTRHNTTPGQHQDQTYLSPQTAAATLSSTTQGLGNIRAASLPSTPSGTAEPPSASVSPRPGADRRLSTASAESMDHSGYGSSSMGGGSAGGMNHMNTPMRPMPNHPGPDIPIKLTPITGRVSRAKKGIPVHTCDVCNKTFTRAEHLRRHQLSHQQPRFPCTYPNCDRAFHRQDLLLRHQQKHEQDGDRASGRGGQLRRDSSQSFTEGSSSRGYASTSPLAPAPMGLSPSTPVSTAGGSTTGSETGQQRGMGAGGAAPISPNYGAPSDSYGQYPRGSMSYPPGSMVSDVPISSGDYVPRTPGPGIPLFVVTRGLDSNSHLHPDSGPPELNYDASPWASSDSSYSTTPATDNRGYSSWVRGQSPATEWTQHLSPYSAVRDHSSLDPLTTSHMFSYSPVTPSSHLPSHSQSHASHYEYLDVPMAGYQHPMMGDPSSHSHTQSSSFSSVRSPSPNTSTAVSTETLVTPAPALPVDRLTMLANLSRQKEMVVDAAMPMYHGAPYVGAGNESPEGILVAQGLGGMGGCGSGGLVLSTPLPSTVRRAIPGFLEVYWSRFHSLYPIVHRPTFEAAGEDVLRCAMAAVATQHMEGKEDRTKGNQLHEYAWQEARRAPQWTTQVMQAILLCEFFARFRGRKAVIKPSKLFESLYSRVLDFANQADFYNQDQGILPEDRWRRWVHGETRRRLLSMCFFLDIHTSIYHEQPRIKDFDLSSGSMPAIPLIGATTPLWNAPAADSWNLAVSSNPASMTPTFLPIWNDVAGAAPFDRAVVLAAEALRLPRRPRGPILPSSVLPTTNAPAPSILSSNSPALSPTTVPSLPLPAPTPSTPVQSTQLPIDIAESTISRLFPDDPIANTYLALHHTPLLDLLAVSGDSWVFSQKVLPENSFVEHQKRLKSWADGRTGSGIGNNGNMSAARATVYAARALGGFLLPGRRQAPGFGDLSEYWAMHVCALICWAFGHRAARGDARAGQVCGDDEVLQWVCDVGKMAVGEVSRVRGRKEAFGVVGVVRRRLEAECVGGRSRLFVDSVGTLKKLEEGANWKWF